MWWRQRPSPMHYGFSIKGQSNGKLLYFFSSWKGLGCCLYIYVLTNTKETRLSVLLGRSLFLLFFLFFFLLCYSLSLPPFIQAKKKERIRLCISFVTRERRRMETWLLEYRGPACCPAFLIISLIHYSGSCCCKISAETSPRRRPATTIQVYTLCVGWL